jgi:ribosome-associated protein
MNKESKPTDIPSKTQRKKEAIELQNLGAQLTSFKPNELDNLDLDLKLRHAINEYQKLPNARGARKRQIQFIGKIMRDCNDDQIRKNISLLRSNANKKQEYSSLVESLVEKIINEGDAAINETIAIYRSLERKKLRDLKNKISEISPENKNNGRDKLKAYLSSALKKDEDL